MTFGVTVTDFDILMNSWNKCEKTVMMNYDSYMMTDKSEIGQDSYQLWTEIGKCSFYSLKESEIKLQRDRTSNDVVDNED